MRSEAGHASPTPWRAPRGPQASRPVRLGLDSRNPPLAISRPMWTLDANLLQLGVPPEGHKLADLHARGARHQEIHVISFLTLHSIDKSIKHRVGGYT